MDILNFVVLNFIDIYFFLDNMIPFYSVSQPKIFLFNPAKSVFGLVWAADKQDLPGHIPAAA